MKLSVQNGTIIFVTLLIVVQTINCRYLPTRSQGNDLDKLRELMIDILDSSNENQEQTNLHHNNLNDMDNSLPKLSNSQRLSLARNIFGSNGGLSKDDSELLSAYLSRYGSQSGHRNSNNSLNKLYGRIQY